MNPAITFQQVVSTLDATGQAYQVLALDNDVSIVVLQRGGRVLGPFLSPTAPSLFWLNPVLADRGTFQAFLDAGEWNLGGERIWIAPEIQYNATDRANFWGTLRVPPQMDPGDYTLTRPAPAAVELHARMTLEAFNLASGVKTLDLARRISPLPDPLRALDGHAALLSGVTYAGYAQQAALSETASDAIMSEVWNLVQLNAGGQLIIPASPHLQATRYFNTVPAEARTVREGALRIAITGDNQYKVGYKAAHLSGKLGYLNHLPDGRAYLLARSYPNNPSSVYVEEAPDRPGSNGESIHVYNDDGAMGGFGEMECHGQTIGGPTGSASQTDTFLLWLYAGPSAQVETIAEHLLGVRL